jgi:hypothetical protein
MNPEDLVDLPSDEDEDAEWVTHHLPPLLQQPVLMSLPMQTL